MFVRYVINGTPNAVNPILFHSLDANAICQAALHTHGAAGPSGLDACARRQMCSSLKATSTDHCSALAAVGHCISTSSVHPEGLSAFVICRLIPLDKALVYVQSGLVKYQGALFSNLY